MADAVDETAEEEPVEAVAFAPGSVDGAGQLALETPNGSGPGGGTAGAGRGAGSRSAACAGPRP